MTHITVVMDNGGGAQLYTEGYSHAYEEGGEQLAQDILALVAGGDPRTEWDGNDLEDIGPTPSYDVDAERNGRYLWFAGSPREVVESLRAASAPWRNLRDTQEALLRLTGGAS